MDRKHGKYVVNVEHSGKQPPRMCAHDQEAQHSTCWCPPSNDVTRNDSSNLSGVWVSPRILAHSECQHPEPCSTQVAGNSCCDWSLWKVFLACLLASVLTTTTGVLTLSLVNRNNSPIIIQLSSNTEASTATPHPSSTSSQTTPVTSTGLTTTTSPETTDTTATITSIEPAGTNTAASSAASTTASSEASSAASSAASSTASSEASTTTTMAMTSTLPVMSTATTTTPTVLTSTSMSTQPTTSPASTETSATTIDSTQPETTPASASSETTPTCSATETLNPA